MFRSVEFAESKFVKGVSSEEVSFKSAKYDTKGTTGLVFSFFSHICEGEAFYLMFIHFML